MLQLSAGLIKYRHSAPCKIDGALAVDGHAKCIEMAEQAFVRESSAGVHVAGVGLINDKVRHVKHLAVGRANDAARLQETGRDTRDGVVVGS